MTEQELMEKLKELDNGVLKAGEHQEGPEFCVLEFDAKLRGRAWSDAPVTLPDIRPINDSFSSDEDRTKALIPVMAALWDWSDWSIEKKFKWTEKVVIETIRQIISELPRLSSTIRENCRTVSTLVEAKNAANAAAAANAAYDAAYAAAAYAAYDAAAYAAAAYAAYAAAYAAYAAAAYAAYAAARTMVLNKACQIWIDAARE